MSKHNLIQELWYKDLDLSVWERDDRHVSGTRVDDTQGFAFSRGGFSLTLKIHGESTSRGIMRAGSKEAMGLILPSFSTSHSGQSARMRRVSPLKFIQ